VKILSVLSPPSSHKFYLFQSIDKRYVAVVIEELLLSLHNSCIPVQPFVYEMLVNCLMKGGQFQKLHQLIAYRVIEDSKPLVSNKIIQIHTVVSTIVRRKVQCHSGKSS